MNSLNVKITGPIGSGKTTLAREISHYLMEIGVDVTFTDGDREINVDFPRPTSSGFFDPNFHVNIDTNFE